MHCMGSTGRGAAAAVRGPQQAKAAAGGAEAGVTVQTDAPPCVCCWAPSTGATWRMACAPRDQPRGLWARRSQASAPPYHSYQVGFQSSAFRRVRLCRSFAWRPGPRIGSAAHRAAKPRLSPSAIIPTAALTMSN